MKILYYSRACFGDCDFPLIKAMRANGHDVTVIIGITPHSMRTTIFSLKHLKPKNGIYPITDYPELRGISKYMPLGNIYLANETTGKFGWRSFKLDMSVLNFFRQGEYDVIQYVETPSLYHFLPLWFFRKKLVLTIHDGKPHTGEKKRNESIRRCVIKNYIKKFIVLNKSEVDVFSQSYSVPLKHIYISHLGYYDILNMYGDRNKKIENYILFFGRISPYKGIEYLLQAMEIVHRTYPDVKVIVAGSGKIYFDSTKYENLDYVDFRNRFIELDELADLIRGALFTVCPYTDATQSGVVYSSFALNTPVIATNVGGLPEMIDDGSTGLIVESKNVDALAKKILYCLDNPESLQAMSNNIIKSAAEGDGSWNIIAKEYTEIYKK